MRAAEHDRKQDRVLAAAAAVFADRGFHRASVRDVVAEAGMSLAGLYHYFPSKAGLLHEITLRAFDSLLARTDSLPPAPPRERLAAFVRSHLAFFLSRPHEMKVLVRETDALPPEVEARKREYYQRCHDIVRDAAFPCPCERGVREICEPRGVVGIVVARGAQPEIFRAPEPAASCRSRYSLAKRSRCWPR